MLFLSRVLAGFLLVCGWIGSAPASGMTPEEAATRLFAAQKVERGWFSHQGLASAVPPLVAELRESLGDFQRVSPCTEVCVALHTGGEFTFNITIDDDGLIAGLLIDVPIVYATSLSEALAAFEALSGEVSVVVTQEATVLGALNMDRPMAVGSAFKLAVLKALQKLIGAGKLDWDQVVRFEDKWRSLPSGQMQDWPERAPVTLHTLASLMISVSDNTATDALIDLVTRNSVEGGAPRNRPFLTTREFFLLKHRDHDAYREQFSAGNYDLKVDVLRALADKPLPRISELVMVPFPGVEWFFSTNELCELMDDLGDLDVMKINPGVARRSDWASVAFKGGSDVGVINLTTGLMAEDGTRYCASATWNDDKAVDEEGFSILYASLLHQLKAKAMP